MQFGDAFDPVPAQPQRAFKHPTMRRKGSEGPNDLALLFTAIGFALGYMFTGFAVIGIVLSVLGMGAVYGLLRKRRLPAGSWFLIMGIGLLLHAVGILLTELLFSKTFVKLTQITDYNVQEYISLALIGIGILTTVIGLQRGQAANWIGYHTWTHSDTSVKTFLPCARCGQQRPTKQVDLHGVRSYLIVMERTMIQVRVCQQCLRELFTGQTVKTAMLGWWGIKSLTRTIVHLPGNIMHFASAYIVPPANHDIVLRLDEQVRFDIGKHHHDMMARLQNGESVATVANDISKSVDVTTREVEVYIMQQKFNQQQY